MSETEKSTLEPQPSTTQEVVTNVAPTPKPTRRERLENQVAATQRRLDQLRAQQAQLEARQRAESAKKRRAADTRRRILLGAYLMQSRTSEELSTLMDSYLTDARDRQLFGLPPRAAAEAAPGAIAPEGGQGWDDGC